MAWKIEKWLSGVFPGKENIFSEYRLLSRRELAIVVAGSLDLALAELIAKRLVDSPKECEEFLGANEDGRAPAGSFGARIQLALLLGIISAQDAAQLRIVKSIRNKFAHRIKVDFTSETVKPLIRKLYDKVVVRTKSLITGGYLPGANNKPQFDMGPYLETTPEAGAALLLSVFCIYQAYFHRLLEIVPRIDDVARPSVTLSFGRHKQG